MKHLLLPLLWSVAASAATPPVTATAAPAGITFSYQVGATLPAAQTVAVKPSAGTPTYTTAITGTNALWLVASPDTGKLPVILSLRANPTSLAVGVYSATITMTVAGVTLPLTVAVTLNITAPASSLTLSAASLTFTVPPFPPANQAVQLTTTGTPISFTATAGSPWLSVSPTVGVVLPGETVLLTVSVDPTGLNPQAAPYVGKITVAQGGTTAGAKTQTITVNCLVSSSQPTITSIWPPIVPMNSGSQTVTVRGANFFTATTAKLQGGSTPLTTTVLSSTALLAVIPAAALTAPAMLNIVVSNPAPGGDSVPSPVMVGNQPVIQSIANVASYGAAAFSPGELVTIFGANLGPNIPASMTTTNGFVDVSLAGVSVTVDGQAAPMLYVSLNQVTLQIPYEVTQGTGKAVVLTNGTSQTNATITMAPTAPGLFTADGSGARQVAALNFNSTTGYTLNATATPVKLGDIIVIYLTGEGDYNPALIPRTGLIVPAALNPLPQVNPLPVVTIGGAVATVNYAGPLPGSILGLLQINAVVPATSTTGPAVPIVVNLGGNTTQSTTTISVHL